MSDPSTAAPAAIHPDDSFLARLAHARLRALEVLIATLEPPHQDDEGSTAANPPPSRDARLAAAQILRIPYKPAPAHAPAHDGPAPPPPPPAPPAPAEPHPVRGTPRPGQIHPRDTAAAALMARAGTAYSSTRSPSSEHPSHAAFDAPLASNTSRPRTSPPALPRPPPTAPRGHDVGHSRLLCRMSVAPR